MKPNYGSFCGDQAARAGKWAHLVGDVADTSEPSPPVKFNADASIHVSELPAGASVPFELRAGRQAYLLVVEGSAAVAGAHGEAQVAQHDGAELYGPSALRFTAGPSGAHLLLVEMAGRG